MVSSQVDLAGLFAQVGFTLSIGEDGGVQYIEDTEDTHYGAGELLEVVAPFVEDDSYIQMISEDQIPWCWYFKAGQLFELDMGVENLRDKSILQHVEECLAARAAQQRPKKQKPK
jgi:hypothetical protein